MTLRGTCLALLALSGLVAAPAVASPSAPSVSADQALTKLKEGNQRHFTKKFIHPEHWEQRRTEVAKGQHPFAIVLGCADSRVPPEIIFDQGLGDLFTVRVAGNIADDSVLGSIEYAAEHLGAPLVMVLGHERCGAVDATLKGGHAAGHVHHLVEAIKPALAASGKPSGDALDHAVRANVQHVVKQLKASKPLLADMVKAGKLKVVGARYDLDSGAVELIP